MAQGIIKTDKVQSSFRHELPLADGTQQHITGKTEVKPGDESVTGHIEFRVTSSAIPLHDDEQYEAMKAEAIEAVTKYIDLYRADLIVANQYVQRGQLNLFRVEPGKKLKAVGGARAPRKKTVASVAAEV